MLAYAEGLKLRGENEPDDKDTSKRVFSYFRGQRCYGERNIRCFLVLRPFLKVLANKENVIGAPVYLHDMSFEGAFSDIVLACCYQSILVVLQTGDVNTILALVPRERNEWKSSYDQ